MMKKTKPGCFPGPIDRLRHWLIRKLSFGDLVMLNFDVRSDGAFEKHNAGPALIADFHIRVVDKQYMIGFGPNRGDTVLCFADKSHFMFLNGVYDPRPLGFSPPPHALRGWRESIWIQPPPPGLHRPA